MWNQRLLKDAKNVVLVLSAALTGCHLGQRTLSELQAPRVTEVGYQAVIPEGASRHQLAPGETVLAPELDEMVAPIFPPALVMAQEWQVQILAHLVIDAEGKVERIIFDETARDTEQEDDLEPFKAAIQDAVKRWVFLPMIVVRPMLVNAEGKHRMKYVPVPVSLWYEFTFSIKNGRTETMINMQEP